MALYKNALPYIEEILKCTRPEKNTFYGTVMKKSNARTFLQGVRSLIIIVIYVTLRVISYHLTGAGEPLYCRNCVVFSVQGAENTPH